MNVLELLAKAYLWVEINGGGEWEREYHMMIMICVIYDDELAWNR